MTTYTLITYEEGSVYYDRWGDRQGNESSFDIQYYTDPQEAAQAYARSSRFDEYKMLINGEDYEDLKYGDDKEKEDLAWQFQALYEEEIKIEKIRQEQIKKDEIQKAAKAAEEKARQLARAEREADEAKFEALKRKLGK